MGGLHGDRDRDFKDTNLNILSQDVADLHADVLRLFAVVIELTKNETDQIDDWLTALRNQVRSLIDTIVDHMTVVFNTVSQGNNRPNDLANRQSI